MLWDTKMILAFQFIYVAAKPAVDFTHKYFLRNFSKDSNSNMIQIITEKIAVFLKSSAIL